MTGIFVGPITIMRTRHDIGQREPKLARVSPRLSPHRSRFDFSMWRTGKYHARNCAAISDSGRFAQDSAHLYQTVLYRR